jgi:hypothetical protein
LPDVLRLTVSIERAVGADMPRPEDQQRAAVTLDHGSLDDIGRKAIAGLGNAFPGAPLVNRASVDRRIGKQRSKTSAVTAAG